MELILIIIVLGVIVYSFSGINKSKTRNKKDENDATEDLISKYDRTYSNLQRLIYNLSPNNEKLPKLIRTSRIVHRGKELYALYSYFLEDLTLNHLELRNNKQFNSPEYLEGIKNALLLIEPYIMFVKMRYEKFDISMAWAISCGLDYYSVFGKTSEVKRIYELVSYIPELNPLKKEALDALRFCEISPEVFKTIKERNGLSSKEVKEIFGEDSSLIQSFLRHSADFKIGRRTLTDNGVFYEID